MSSSALNPAPLMALLLAGCGAASATPEPPRAAYAAIASGRIDAAGEARHLVAERDGIIAAVRVHEGERVAAGQPLLSLACADAEHAAAAAGAAAAAAAADQRLTAAGPRREAIAEAAARADEAGIRARDARDLLMRAEALQHDGFVSRRRLTELAADAAARAAAEAAANATYAAARAGARPDEQRAAAATARQRQEAAAEAAAAAAKCTLRSPIAGTVLRIHRREGEFSGASQGAPLIVVGALDRIMVRAEFVERDALAVRIGAPVTVWIDGDTRRWTGHIAGAGALMGRRTARSTDAAERFDGDILEATIRFAGAAPPPLVGLRVNVGIRNT